MPADGVPVEPDPLPGLEGVEPVEDGPEGVDPGSEPAGALTPAGAVPVRLPTTVPTVVPSPDTTDTIPDSGPGVLLVPDDAAAEADVDGVMPAPALVGVDAPATAGALSVSTAVASPAIATRAVKRAAAIGMPDVVVGILDKSNLTASSPKTTPPKIIGRELSR